MAAGVGAAVALGVGDGSALSVVGPAVGCPEDALLSGSSVARSESGRSVASAVARSEDIVQGGQPGQPPPHNIIDVMQSAGAGQAIPDGGLGQQRFEAGANIC